MIFDDRTEKNIATLTTATQAVARTFMQAIIDSGKLPAGWKVEIISGTRTYAQQADIYAQGRTIPGKKVTDAAPGWSNHNFGIAFDLGLYDATGRYIDNLPDQDRDWTENRVSSYYRALAPIGEQLGLTWGGDWISIDDEPHYELHPWPGLDEHDTLAKLRAMHANGEVIA